MTNIEELQKACTCLYIAVDKSVADDIKRKLELVIVDNDKYKEGLSKILKLVEEDIKIDVGTAFQNIPWTDALAIRNICNRVLTEKENK